MTITYLVETDNGQACYHEELSSAIGMVVAEALKVLSTDKPQVEINISIIKETHG